MSSVASLEQQRKNRQHLRLQRILNGLEVICMPHQQETTSFIHWNATGTMSLELPSKYYYYYSLLQPSNIRNVAIIFPDS